KVEGALHSRQQAAKFRNEIPGLDMHPGKVRGGIRRIRPADLLERRDEFQHGGVHLLKALLCICGNSRSARPCTGIDVAGRSIVTLEFGKTGCTAAAERHNYNCACILHDEFQIQYSISTHICATCRLSRVAKLVCQTSSSTRSAGSRKSAS